MSGTGRRAAASASAAAVAAGLLAGAAPAQAATGTETDLRLVAATSRVVLERFEGDWVPFDVGMHVVAGDAPLEIRASRSSYKRPITASLTRFGPAEDGALPARVGSAALPDGLIDDFTGLSDFLEVTVRDAEGSVVLRRDQAWCPANEAARARPSAPSSNPYPWGCAGYNPFTLGAVWGLPAGWSSQVAHWDGEPLDLADGEYAVTARIAPAYRRLFAIPSSSATARTTLVVRTVESPPDWEPWSGSVMTAAAAPEASPAPIPAARPRSSAQVPADVPLPDLRSLPAWGIGLVAGGENPEGEVPDGENPDGEVPDGELPDGELPDGELPWEDPWSPELPEGDHLVFNATVWNAGPLPLVVDGYRNAGADVMDAYQFFHDASGRQVGHQRAGAFEWDDQDGHMHWHFRDFATYSLLDSRRRPVMPSQKEAFCLANTDAVDYTVPGANWRPGGTDLHTACGTPTSLGLRQVLDVGSGDTYAQYLPGQSFDVTDLPNGTYYIEVVANPDRRLHETTTGNNRSLRRLVLGGQPGARTVDVPAVHGLDGGEGGHVGDHR